MQTPPQSPRHMICPGAPIKKPRDWEDHPIVTNYLNDENPSLETTVEAYYFRDINMNISINKTLDFIITKLQPNENLLNELNIRYKSNDHKGLYECLTIQDLCCLGW